MWRHPHNVGIQVYKYHGIENYIHNNDSFRMAGIKQNEGETIPYIHRLNRRDKDMKTFAPKRREEKTYSQQYC